MENLDKLVVPFSGHKSHFYDYDFLVYDYKSVDLSVFSNRGLPWFERYREVLPLGKMIEPIGDFDTPFFPSKVFENCYFKDEGRNPSGCFKDRESAVVMSHFVSQGVKDFIIVSSGNAALSASLYASIYKSRIKCIVPEGTSQSKLDLIRLYGSELEFGGADYEECYHRLAGLDLPIGTINITPGVCSLRDQGDKVIAFEIFQDLGEVPDYVLVPSANGSLLFGIYNGFRELMELGLSDRLPKLLAVQIDGGAPIDQALKLNKDFVVLDHCVDSLAEGLVAIESYCAPKALHALKESGGEVVLVSDQQFDEAMRYAVREEGVLPEWTSVAGFAALQEAYSSGLIDESLKVVLINSGSGIKDAGEIAKIFTV